MARSKGWEVLFLTLTMRHNAGHSLNKLWNHLSEAWGAVTTGKGQRAWKQDKELYGIAGYLRLVEVTHGSSGWHVHAHVLLFCDPSAAALNDGEQGALARATGRVDGAKVHGAGFTDEDVNALGTSIFLRWRGALNVSGIRPSLRRGVDIRRVRADDKIADYFAKQMYNLKGESSTAHDVSGSHGKDAKNGNRTPFGILASLVDVAATGEVGDGYDETQAERDRLEDLELWHTFEHASRGRRQLLWSRGFRDKMLAGLDDLDDQDVVDEAPGGTIYVYGDRDTYRHLVKRRLLAQLLEAAEADDTGWTLRGWLDSLGLEWSATPPRPPDRT